MLYKKSLQFIFILFLPVLLWSQQLPSLSLLDVYSLEYVSDPQVSPAGNQVVYVRNTMDIMKDGPISNLWVVDIASGEHRPLTAGTQRYSSPRWSPDGKRLLFLSSRDGSTEIYLRWMDTGAETKLTNLSESPGGIQWSPDGTQIAFQLEVPIPSTPLTKLPSPPEDAKWAPAPKYIDLLQYRSDGVGYLNPGFTHLFVVGVEGGTPRQITQGEFNHGGDFCWTPDGKFLLVTANRHPQAAYDPLNTEIYEVAVSNGATKALTSRQGPDGHPAISPDGRLVAYTGFDDRYQGYQVTQLYVMNRDGSNPRLVSKSLDRDVDDLAWAADNKSLFIQYDSEGDTYLGRIDLSGQVSTLATQIGGLSLGRPYGGGSFSVAKDGTFAFTHTGPDHPADLAVGKAGQPVRRLTQVNADLFNQRTLGAVEEIWVNSSFDSRRVQGWLIKPPGFDPAKKYPLLLEIHGGPFSNYGPRFTMELQLFAAAGYVVLYTNPRGSTSYGEAFGNLIHHNYPGQDYDDLMTCVDAAIGKGYIDPNQLYITGGSGGGVLTAWTIGKTNRFRAAVVAKPVINWYSFVLHADNPAFFYKYWFPGFPWENTEHYMQRSPISLVGNVQTPTMLLTGEQDYRTPISESEQYYAALKLRQVDCAMVRIQESGHGIANRPSNLMNKVGYILGWFDKYREKSSK
ncbi:MAG: S9 family peptidase [Lewinellaceae bacterium]|nr:S9 family peptidase [Lewinellaceae bacterium]